MFCSCTYHLRLGIDLQGTVPAFHYQWDSNYLLDIQPCYSRWIAMLANIVMYKSCTSLLVIALKDISVKKDLLQRQLRNAQQATIALKAHLQKSPAHRARSIQHRACMNHRIVRAAQLGTTALHLQPLQLLTCASRASTVHRDHREITRLNVQQVVTVPLVVESRYRALQVNTKTKMVCTTAKHARLETIAKVKETTPQQRVYPDIIAQLTHHQDTNTHALLVGIVINRGVRK
jgi:hypothetical protein